MELRDYLRILRAHWLGIVVLTVLGAAVDGVLLIVSAGRTTYEMMQKAVENIGKANGRVLGIVLNKVPLRGADAAAYGYQYRGDYAAVAPTAPAPAKGAAKGAAKAAAKPQAAAPATRRRRAEERADQNT